MSKRTLQMNRRRDRILDAAREVISEEGYEHLTMRSLAESSGVTVPTIYNLIGNKDAVLAATIHEGTLRFFENARPNSNPISILEKNVELLLLQPAYYRPLIQVLLNGGASESMVEINALYLQHLNDNLAALAERGELEPWVDCSVLAERMLSTFYGATSAWAAGLLSDAALPIATGYDANLILAGVATEASRARFQSRARRLQKSLGETRQVRRVRSRSSSGDRV